MSLTISLTHTNMLSLSQVTHLCCTCGQMQTQILVNAINSLVLSFFWASSRPVSGTISLKPHMYWSLWSEGLYNRVGKFILYMAGPLMSDALIFLWERNWENSPHVCFFSFMTTSVQVRGRDDHSSPAQEWEHLKLVYTVSPLRKNLQDENFQRC